MVLILEWFGIEGLAEIGHQLVGILKAFSLLEPCSTISESGSESWIFVRQESLEKEDLSSETF